MNATGFAYWIQGFFEIHGNDPVLTDQQAQLVLKTARAVKGGDSNSERDAQAFVDYTAGMLFMCELGLTPKGFLEKASKELRQQLHDLFVHAIDPSYEGDQEHFHDLHNPGRDKRNNNGFTPKC